MPARTMLAVQLAAWGRPPELREVPVPTPVGTEVVIGVLAAGVCRSDLHVMAAGPDDFAYPLPMTLGHEVVGEVIEVGDPGDVGWVGERVVVHGIWGCGSCPNCTRGRENYCVRLLPDAAGRRTPIGNGLGFDGGLAQAMLVPSTRHLVRIGDLDPVQAAPLADAGLTAFHAIAEHRDIIDEKSVVGVIGVGGLGHIAVQLLKRMGAGTVCAVDNRESAIAFARELGADRAGTSLPEVLDGSLADIVFDFAGHQSTMTPGLAALAPGGRFVVVGTAGGELTLGKHLGLASGWRVQAPFWGPARHLSEVVDVAAQGGIAAEAAVFPLAEALEVYRRLDAGEITGRAVVVPPPLT
ncbi:alcohol dehydrogenase catalytic domain-containing protein [Gordonia sp. HY002]|uniref:alcohol dehydrogenase catalytic domain-containing protein n=1 Tax=Gordonia zhenghanii TaxID=2911516 RepID=UPI001EF0B692|nr:alcohol dehydrogenase catalytic domain-containing protein [Gordonia zhenghanii]MCF8571904.1 alcohol dehydrogenase catalytic domain-containing protein [Gordonia zhenghanii]MCF8605912.1 alcohol dehydrogenase catalytic domain-containing protein [Gordonia zhenghanii]